MRRIFFILFMLFVVAFVFYGLPLYQYYALGLRPEVVEPVEAKAEPSYVEAYKMREVEERADKRPIDVINAYSRALITGQLYDHLHLFTLRSQLILQRGRFTEVQQKQLALALESCFPGQSLQRGMYAVTRFAPSRRECAPFFMVQEDEQWHLDFYSMQNEIIFNTDNLWHFRNVEAFLESDYGFAFHDWRFDRNGYPLSSN